MILSVYNNNAKYFLKKEIAYITYFENGNNAETSYNDKLTAIKKGIQYNWMPVTHND